MILICWVRSDLKVNDPLFGLGKACKIYLSVLYSLMPIHDETYCVKSWIEVHPALVAEVIVYVVVTVGEIRNGLDTGTEFKEYEMPVPCILILAAPPIQRTEALELTLNTGNGSTVMCAKAVSVQPFAPVPVTI